MKKKNIIAVLVAVVVIIAAVLLVSRYLKARTPILLQGTTECTTYKASSKIAGRIVDMKVEEGDRVEKGQLLYTLSTPELDAKLQQAEAVKSAAAALRRKLPANYAGTRKEPQKNPKRTCQTSGHCCIIQTYQSKRTDAEGLLFRQERKAMTNTGRKKRRKNAVVTMAFRLFFVLLLLSMLAAYISNQVTISSKRAELETLNEQVAQQQTENQELQRVLSGDADQITEWVARDSYNYAAPNERIFVDVTGN